MWAQPVSDKTVGPNRQLHLLPTAILCAVLSVNMWRQTTASGDGRQQLGFWRTLLLPPAIERGRPGEAGRLGSVDGHGRL